MTAAPTDVHAPDIELGRGPFAPGARASSGASSGDVTDALGAVAARVRCATVEITTPDGRAMGAGVLWPYAALAGREAAPAGCVVVTNAHVARWGYAARGAHGPLHEGSGIARIRFANGSVAGARTLALDGARDLAVLVLASHTAGTARVGTDVDAAAANEPTAADVGDSEQRRAGELVLAVGNPLGVPGAVSVGVLHAARAVRGPFGRWWLAADVRLAPGNSGGPLADARGRVVGINAMVAYGLGLAVPSAAVERFLDRVARAAERASTARARAAP